MNLIKATLILQMHDRFENLFADLSKTIQITRLGNIQRSKSKCAFKETQIPKKMPIYHTDKIAICYLQSLLGMLIL